MALYDTLPVYKDVYALILLLYELTGHFPREYKYTIEQNMKYLTDVLKNQTGKNSQEHIHLALVDKAKTMLLSTTKSVSEVAYDLGFEYPSHFSKLFKTKTGKSPSQYSMLN